MTDPPFYQASSDPMIQRDIVGSNDVLCVPLYNRENSTGARFGGYAMTQVLKGRRRLVVKVGSSSITDQQGTLSINKLQNIVSQLAILQNSKKWEIVLVSSGAIAAGIGKLGWRRENITIPEKQAAAAVGQTLLMETYERLFALEHIVVGQLLLTRSDVADRKRFVHIRNTMSTLMHHGVIPIINENDTVAVEEIRFGDNDTLASLTALVAEADKLVLLTDIDGLYTGDPRSNPQATKLSEVTEINDEIEAIAGGSGSAVGTGGMRTKVSAAKIAVQSGIDVMIASSEEPDVLLRICKGEERVGTLFHASSAPLARKKSWLTYAPQPEGFLRVDEGAERALMQTGSLLLPGILLAQGDFQVGDVVELQNGTGQVIGKGISNFSCRDLTALLALRNEGQRLYNVHEVVHRNDMVLTEGGM